MKRIILLMVVIIMVSACGRNEKIDIPYDGRMVVLGDSIANGYGVEKGFTQYLDERLVVEVHTLGKNGGTTREVVIVKFYPRRSILGIFFRKERKDYEEMYRELQKVEGVHVVDTIHPDSRGHEVMADNLEKSLKKIFAGDIFID